MPRSPSGMLVSLGVVITLFNGAAWIEQTLSSVLAQSLTPDEIVVVDDGSKDDGPERVARFSDVRLVHSWAKRRARHTGFHHTTASRLSFLDQDDLWHPEHLRGLVAALDATPGVPAAASGWQNFYDGETARFEPQIHGTQWLDPWATWPITCPITTPSAVLFRRTALEAAGAWALDAAPDWATYMRITAPAKILRLRAVTCAYRVHPRARSAELRRDGFAYLKIQRDGADAALEERLARGVDEPTQILLKRRHGLLSPMEHLMRAVASNDRPGAARAACEIEASVKDESDAYVDGIFGVLTYLFCPDDDAASYKRLRRELLSRLLDVWPPHAPRTGRLLRRHGYPPFRWRRWWRALLRLRLAEAQRLWGTR